MSSSIETVSLENAIATIQNRINRECYYTPILYDILAYCSADRSLEDIENRVHSSPKMKIDVYSPQILMQWLVDAGGIEPCDGGDGATWKTTAAGLAVVDINRPSKMLETLVSEDKDHEDLLREVLRFCGVPRSTNEIERLLEKYDTLAKEGVYPSYFISELEKGGGLEWNDGWSTTPAGRAFLA